jgi:hypothetical protein
LTSFFLKNVLILWTAVLRLVCHACIDNNHDENNDQQSATNSHSPSQTHQHQHQNNHYKQIQYETYRPYYVNDKALHLQKLVLVGLAPQKLNAGKVTQCSINKTKQIDTSKEACKTTHTQSHGHQQEAAPARITKTNNTMSTIKIHNLMLTHVNNSAPFTPHEGTQQPH